MQMKAIEQFFHVTLLLSVAAPRAPELRRSGVGGEVSFVLLALSAFLPSVNSSFVPKIRRTGSPAPLLDLPLTMVYNVF